MDIKIISGARLDKQKPGLTAVKAKPEATALQRNLALPITAAVGVVPQVAESLVNFIAGRVPKLEKNKHNEFYTQKEREPIRLPGTSQHLRENVVAPALGVSSQSLKPQGMTEEILESVYSDLPLILATGGAATGKSLASSLGKSASVTSGMKIAEKAGLGIPGQLVGGLFGAKIGNQLGSAIEGYYTGAKSTAGLRPFLENTSKEAYAKSNELFKGKVGDFTKPGDKIRNVLQESNKGIPTQAKDFIKQELGKIHKFEENGKMSLANAMAIKQDFYDHAYKSNYDKKTTGVFKQVGRYFKDFIDEEGSKFPEAYKAYKQGEELHSILNAKDEVTGLIKDYFNPATFAKNGILKTLFKSSLGLAGTLPIAETTKFLVRRPEARKYYFDVYKNIIKDNPTAAVNSLRKLVKITEKEDSKTSEEPKRKSTQPKDIQIVQGRRLE